jgi:tRNA-dihydrouridine synthase
MVAQTGCDAVMIGRMAPANPWIFRQIEQYTARTGTTCVGPGLGPGQAERSLAIALEWPVDEPAELRPAQPGQRPGSTQLDPNTLYDEPTEADRYQMIRTYFQMLLEEEMPGSEGKMKQFASWFTHGVPGGGALRKAIYEAKSGAAILASVEEFFENRLHVQVT